MKNLNLTGLYLAMVAEFGVSGFELSSIIPKGKEPIDCMIEFKGGNFAYIDMEGAAEKCEKVQSFLKENLTSDIKTDKISIKNGALSIYLEFTNSTFTES